MGVNITMILLKTYLDRNLPWYVNSAPQTWFSYGVRNVVSQQLESWEECATSTKCSTDLILVSLGVFHVSYVGECWVGSLNNNPAMAPLLSIPHGPIPTLSMVIRDHNEDDPHLYGFIPELL